MTSLRFLQFSDLHIGRGFSGPPFTLDEETRNTLRSDRATVLKNIVDLATNREVDLVLIPGDLFEERRLREKDARRLRDAIESLFPVPVVVAPGMHDCYDRLSWYHPAVMEQHGLDPWPENLHVFTSDQFETMHLSGSVDLFVTGVAHRSHECRAVRLLQKNVMEDRSSPHLLMMYGSVEESSESDAETTLPVARHELLNQDAAYVALGSRHEEWELREEGVVRGAYAGAPKPVRFDDAGDRTVMVGTLTEEGVDPKSVERVRVQPRGIHDLEWRENEAAMEDDVEELCRQIDAFLREQGVKEDDLIRLRWTGRRPSPALLQSDSFAKLTDPYLHLHVDLSTATGAPDPASMEEKFSERTSRGRFVRAMNERIENAETDERREVAEKAFQIGIGAFRNEEVDLDHVL